MVHVKGTGHVLFPLNHETDMVKLFMGSEIIPNKSGQMAYYDKPTHYKW